MSIASEQKEIVSAETTADDIDFLLLDLEATIAVTEKEGYIDYYLTDSSRYASFLVPNLWFTWNAWEESFDTHDFCDVIAVAVIQGRKERFVCYRCFEEKPDDERVRRRLACKDCTYPFEYDAPKRERKTKRPQGKGGIIG